jgi:ribosomal protein L21E
MRDDYKIHYEIYEGALEYLNEKMRAQGKPEIKSINYDYQKGDLVLIKDNTKYHVGAFNGVYIQIVRSDVDIPKSETELELDRRRQENEKKGEELKSTELTSETDAEEFQKAQLKKREKYFEDFKKAFNLDNTITLEMVYSDTEAFGALETFVSSQEKKIVDEASEYMDVE